jgi:hypothetical protein
MARPTKVGIMVKETGGTETFVMPKALCGGEWVLLAPVIRYAILEEDKEEVEQAPQVVTSVTMEQRVGIHGEEHPYLHF